MEDVVLEVAAVEKQFATVKAVDRLSFDVRRGEIRALLGPNGAGKTTTVRMLMDIIRPDQGAIRWRLDGGAPARPQPRVIGYLPEERGLYKEVPVLRTLTYFGILRGMDREDALRSASGWLERLGLADRGRDKIDALSRGNQQKVQFIASILHRPAFAVLDEPFSGLDPVNQDLFLELLDELREDGMTILLSAHQMQLVERIADRILLINRGRSVLDGTLDEIRGSTRAANKILLKVRGNPDLASLERHRAIESVEPVSAGELMLLVAEGQPLSDLLVTLGSDLDIVGVHAERLSLHDIYVRAVRADATGDRAGTDA